MCLSLHNRLQMRTQFSSELKSYSFDPNFKSSMNNNFIRFTDILFNAFEDYKLL